MRNPCGRFLVPMILAILLAMSGLLIPGGSEVALAADCVVMATADSGPGSLREKLDDPMCSAITFAVTGTIGLVGDLPTLTRTVSIIGPGAASLTIDGRGGNGELYLTGFTLGAGGNLTLRGLTVSGMSRGIYTRTSGATLSVDSSTFTGNNNVLFWGGGNVTVANSTFTNNVGFGIYVDAGPGPVTVTNSTFGENYGGINANHALTTVSDSTFRNNQFYGLFAAGTAFLTNTIFGGNAIGISVSGEVSVISSTISGSGTNGIQSQGNVSVVSSTISGNGENGVYQFFSGSVNVANSTISGNAADGLRVPSGFVTTTNATVSGNGGYGLQMGSGTATLTNTLLATNTAANCNYPIDFSEFTLTDRGRNLDDGTSCSFGPASLSRVMAGLSSQGLADNGGPTKTIALAAGSAAIDAGDNAACAAAPVNGADQRGVGRTVGAGPSCDIGAYEVADVAAAITLDAATLNQTYDGTPRVVTATTVPARLIYDVSYNGSATPPTAAGSYPVVATITAPGYTGSASGTLVVAPLANCAVTTLADSGPGSLREKLPNCRAITFGVTGTITLTSDLPTVTSAVSVTGPGAELLTIRTERSLTTTIFAVGAGGDLTVQGLTLRDARSGVTVTGDGRLAVVSSTFSDIFTGVQLYSGGSVAVTASTISSESSGLYFNSGGSATVNGSTFRGAGSGLNFNLGGSATVANSTFNGQSFALVTGGGGNATLINTTFSGSEGALLVQGASNVTLTNSILAQSATANCRAILGGTITNGGYNLADDTSCFANGANSSIVVAAGSAGLASAGLADNGGPTQTIALVTGSPAINAGNNSVCAATPVNGVDQRGISRTAGAGPNCDIGAYEAPGEVAATITLDAATLAQTYDGTPRVVTATTVPAGLPYSVAYNGSATPPTAAGSYPVVATVTAPGYTGSTTGTLVVAQANQTIAFTSTVPSGSVYGGTYSVAATGGASGNPVTFSSLTSAICTVSGSAVKFVGVGTCTVAANQASNANYKAAAQATQNIAVGKATLTVTAPSVSRTVGAANPTFTPTATGLVSPDTTASLGITCTSAANQGSPAGTYDITCASAAPIANYNASYVKGTLTVTSAATTLTITSPANLERKDRGKVTVTAKLTGPGGAALAGKTITFTAGGATASATTNSAGVASAILTLAADQYTLTARFAGGNGQQAASATQTIIAYQLTQFVIWGGNPGGVSTGKTYTFWSSQWAKQVTGGDYRANNSFKGYAGEISSDGKRWTTKPSDRCEMPERLGKYIAVLVSTSITKDGSTIKGNVTKLVILRVDDYRDFDPDDRHTGTGVLVATIP